MCNQISSSQRFLFDQRGARFNPLDFFRRQPALDYRKAQALLQSSSQRFRRFPNFRRRKRLWGVPPIKVVGNAYVSLMAYQAKGYAYSRQ